MRPRSMATTSCGLAIAILLIGVRLRIDHPARHCTGRHTNHGTTSPGVFLRCSRVVSRCLSGIILGGVSQQRRLCAAVLGDIMSLEINYSSEALQQLERLRGFDSPAILTEIEEVLAVNPTLVSKARVKRLRQPAPTQYRLRVGDYRVFYDVEPATKVVDVIQVLSKEESIRFLKENQ